MLAVAALAGCQNLGESALDAEVARVRGNKYFRVISSTSDRAVFSARGQKVVVEPPQGYCLDNGSLAVNHKAAFVLVADCLEASGVELAQGTGQGKVVEKRPQDRVVRAADVVAEQDDQHDRETGRGQRDATYQTRHVRHLSLSASAPS